MLSVIPSRFRFFLCCLLPLALASIHSVAQTDSTRHGLKLISVAEDQVKTRDSISADTTRYVIHAITFSGNKKTKSFIMERELTFHVGDTLAGGSFLVNAERSRKNLLNTALFNFVTITPSCEIDSLVGVTAMTVNIDVKERWYTWPSPIFEVAEQNVNTWYRNGHNLNRASYGFFLWKYNFRGRRESIALICRFGYAQQFGGQYAIPSFNKKGTLGATFTGTFTRSHEVSFNTQNNTLRYFKDSDKFIRSETAGSILFSYRQGIYIRHTLETKYSLLNVNDTVLDIASDYFVDGKTRMEYFTLSYHAVRDYRDIKAYPLHGNFEEIEVTKHGLGILADERLNIFFVAASARIYKQLGDRFYLAAMLRGRWMPYGVQPFYHQRALGFGPYVRGYEYYVIDGQSYTLAKFTFRYELLKPHVYKFDFLPIEKFNTFHLAIYPGVFCDAGYVEDRSSIFTDNNYLGNNYLIGYGVGVDLVTYYDVAIRFEYTFNKEGENGFFLHMGAPF